MVKFYFTIILLITFSQCSFSQSNWFWQNPLPQGNNLFGLKVFDENNALCISSNNVLRTSNGGENWNVINTGFPGVNSCISVYDQNSGFILIDSNVLIKSSNGGYNWFHFNDLNNVRVPVSLKFINANTGFLLSRLDYSVAGGTQLLRTSNGGLTWDVIIYDNNYEVKYISFPDQFTGYAAGSIYFGGDNYKTVLLKTTNAGVNWDSISISLNSDPMSFYFINNNTGLISFWNSIFKTTNSGINWFLINNSSGMSMFQFLDSLKGFGLNFYGYIFKTTDGGINWQRLSDPKFNDFNFVNSNICYSVGYVGRIARTSNGGNNWIRQDTRITDETLWDISFSDNNTGFITGEYGTLLKTVNGGTNWILTDFNVDLSAIGKADSQIWYIASFGKILKTTNTGLTWDTLYVELPSITRLDFINANTGFGVCKYGTFFKTTNGGQSWIIDNTHWSFQSWSLDFIDENTGFAGGNITRKTTNGGTNWEAINFGQYYYSSDIQFVNHNTGFIATNPSLVESSNSSTGTILKTTNGGLNWQPKQIGGGSVLDINFVNERIGFALIGYQLNGGDIYKTTDGGENWVRSIASNNDYLTTICFPDSLTGYIVGFSGIIMKTTNGGISPVGIEPVSIEIPNSFSLLQNYPNPFNPVTHLEFGISKLGFVSLKVYDMLGKEVRTLVNENKFVGRYVVEFDGSNLSSGIYFYRLNFDETKFETKKMLLLK